MNNSKPVEPGCETCWKAETCSRARPGRFCTEWQSEEAVPKGEDPNELWRRGEDETHL